MTDLANQLGTPATRTGGASTLTAPATTRASGVRQVAGQYTNHARTNPSAIDHNDPHQQVYDQIQAYLASMDLSGLFTTAADGSPGGWLWQQITSGIDSADALQLAIESTQPFQNRYGVIADMRKLFQEGKVSHVPNVSQVRDYEHTVLDTLRQAGLPPEFYDSYQDAQGLMRLGLSAVEVEQRVGESWTRVQNTDPAVRATFNSFFGVNGDGALAAMFLDPAHTQANLDRMSRTAYTAGMGSKMGVNIDQATADRIAGLPKTDAGIYQDLTQISGLQGSGIFEKNIGESNDANLTASKTGVDAVAFGSGEANKAIEDRTIERNAQRAAVPGGAVRTNKGLTGAGTAKT